jgi:hypothetical protein
MDKETLKQIKVLIDQIEDNLEELKHLVFGQGYQSRTENLKVEGQVIEGIYDGEQMIVKGGRKYPVPANYASKSKLVPGDLLKLTIAQDGSFIFKQIGPVERQKLIGQIEETKGRFQVKANGQRYSLLQAAITYFHANPGDEVTIIVPKEGESNWAALENVIQHHQ